MRILIVCVTYKSYDALDQYCKSISLAAKNCSAAEVTVLVGDNTDNDYCEIYNTYENIKVEAFPYHENIGYLGCAFRVLNDFGRDRFLQFDYVAISNVDLILADDFFVNLLNINDSSLGWIAPDVYVPSRDTHENPFMMSRPAKNDFIRWEFMYASPFLYTLLEKWAYNRRKQQIIDKPVAMYAGHGSMMIFTKTFFELQEELYYPCFMYAEEFFLAEIIAKHGLKVEYHPELKVESPGSVSVSLLGNKWKCRQNIKSLRVIRKMFFQ